MALKRCRWCGQFVLANTEPTTRSLLSVGWQEPPGSWRTVQQLLCPVCAELVDGHAMEQGSRHVIAG